jgi:hypothetical protein
MEPPPGFPEARPMITGIMVGSSLKGLLVGLLSGWLANKVHSLARGIAAGAAIGLLLSFAVAAMGTVNGRHPYLEIMMPGFVVGAMVGFLTQRPPRPFTPPAR